MASFRGVPAGQPPAAPSHAEFLLEQTRQNVRQLEATHTIDPLICRQLTALLAQAVVKPPPEVPARAAAAPVARDASKELDARNKWAREMMADTSFLPTLVDTALQAAAGPLLTGSQRQAIVEIVSMSQERIANALTNPDYQRNTQRFAVESAKATQSGIAKGWRNVNDQWAKKREQNASKADQKRLEKREAKAIQEELRREKEAFAKGEGLPPISSSSSPEPSFSRSSVSSIPDMSQLVIGDADPGAASVVGLPTQHVLQNSEILSQGGAVCTTYSPWPGLVLTSTIVASAYDQPFEGDVDSITDGRRLPPRMGSVPLPPRPAPPPPVPAPPMHPVHQSNAATDYRPPPPPSRAAPVSPASHSPALMQEQMAHAGPPPVYTAQTLPPTLQPAHRQYR
ncbi:hypothetical protein MCUN1_001841 [Malassezia cuniculi]|uniref:Uncharacterized protein n=1 Tax=Malassezia cuniculi TaxID=948313 RepID=A0AAF0J6F4_9BASI|nr:hypothetical protein MCUN1_001841 [Malassezia cuniculi]